MVRVGIAGIGYIAEEYIKLFSQGKIKNAEIFALSSRNETHMKMIANKYGLNVSLFTDYDTMLTSGVIDMVMICTPHFYHPGMAVRAMEAGIHTMIEKPVGVFPEELDALMDCIHSHPGIQSGVLYCRRANPVYAKIRQLLANRAIGDLKRVTWIITNMYRPQCYFHTADWRGTYSGEGGGMLMNQVSHHIDLLTWFCGLPEALQAHCYAGCERNIEVENEVSVTMEYPGGAIGQFIASTREFPGSNRLELSGSLGQIILDNETQLTVRCLETDEKIFALATDNPYPSIPYTEETNHYEPIANPDIQAAIINNFIDALSGNTQVLCPVPEAVITQQFIQGAYLSGWNGAKLTLPADAADYTKELRKRMK